MVISLAVRHIPNSECCFAGYVFTYNNRCIPKDWNAFCSCGNYLIAKTERVEVDLPLGLTNAFQNDEVLYRFSANALLTKSVLHLHSSFVLYNGRALVFTGPSGIGKTTQAELWRDFQGAEIINGDACLLRELEDGWHAFGTPVHGSSPYCENKDAPLAALVALEQGPENRLERLDSFAALSACLPEFYRPKMDEQTQDIFWNAVDSIFRKTPVYRLVCRPDRDATELVKRTVFPAG